MEKSARNYLLLLEDSLAIKFSPLRPHPPPPPPSPTCGVAGGSGAVQEELRGRALFEVFREVNSPCVWNPQLQEALQQLEYKGSIEPSTLLVTTPCSEALKSAWCRQILKCPPSHKIDFVGEIEELLADPLLQTNFIPLSDSVCWAVHQLNTRGKEAFVEDILGELCSSHPHTTPPPKELLYQVLERLTKANKVYQTNNGYFVHTPPPPSPPKETLEEGDGERGGVSALNESGSESDIYHKADQTTLTNTGKKHPRVSGCLPRKAFSLRAKSTTPTTTTTTSPTHSASHLTLSKDSLVVNKRRKHKSFLKNLIPFRPSHKATPTPQKCVAPPNRALQLQCSEMSTQTSHSLENLGTSLGLLSVSTNTTPTNSSPTSHKHLDPEMDSDSGRFTENSEPDPQHQQQSPTSQVTPTPRPPSSLSSSSAYLFNNPYRRRFLTYHTPTATYLRGGGVSPKSPLPIKYPPRPFERRHIYDKLCKPVEKLITMTTPPLKAQVETTPTTYNSNVQVELLLPMGQLINKVLTDFDDKKEGGGGGCGGNGSKGAEVSFKNSIQSTTDHPLFNSRVELTTHFRATPNNKSHRVEPISSKPGGVLVGGGLCRESDI